MPSDIGIRQEKDNLLTLANLIRARVYIAADPQMKPRLLQGMGVVELETTDKLKEWVSGRKVLGIVNALA
ncbi:unnamed protein product, partial [marine sediment metagenome]